MNQRITLEPAFILHSRPYSNTSLIVDLLTQNHGRQSALARSARGVKSRYKGQLQSFTPMLVSFSGRKELKSLGQVELNGMPFHLQGNALMCGFYLNELIVRLLEREDPYPSVFEDYQHALLALTQSKNLSVILRCFEKRFLQALGYGIPLYYEAQTHALIQSDLQYQYIPMRGFLRCEVAAEGVLLMRGDSIIALAQECFTQEYQLQEAKRLMRFVLQRHLGAKPLKSRELLLS